MANQKLLGYRVLQPSAYGFITHSETARKATFVDGNVFEPPPVPYPQALRNLASFMTQHPELSPEDFTIEPVYREPTPEESAGAELAGLLESLCNRHGLDLGLTREQMEQCLSSELEEFRETGKLRLF